MNGSQRLKVVMSEPLDICFFGFVILNNSKGFAAVIINGEIYAKLSNKLEARLDPYRTSQTLCALDKSIFEIRKTLEAEQKTTEIDFYKPPLRAMWRENEELDDLEDISAQDLEEAIVKQTVRY